MRTRWLFAALALLLVLPPPPARAEDPPPIDYDAYFELLPEMNRISEQSMQSVYRLNDLMNMLLQTTDEDAAAGLRAQIRPVLTDHRSLKLRMIRLVERIFRAPPAAREDVGALRALRNATLRRVNWNNTFFKYVARDISQAIGVPINLNPKVVQMNTVEISFPEISAEGALEIVCKGFDLKWIIYGGEFYVMKKVGPNEDRFIEWEKKHGKVDWIKEDEQKTYEGVDVAEARRELKKLEDMDLPLLKQNLTKIYILEGESRKHELRLEEFKLLEQSRQMFHEEPRDEQERQTLVKRKKHIVHFLRMEKENAIEVWDIINRVLGDVLELGEDDEQLRRLLQTEIRSIEWVNKDLEEALYELGRMVGVEVEAELPFTVEMTVNLSVENVNLETVINLICDFHPLDWRFVRGKLYFAHIQSGD